MRRVVITGTSSGIGKATAELFLSHNFEVIGLDKDSATIVSEYYKHIVCDIRSNMLPVINNVDILINNAGVQNSEDDIAVNLKGSIKITEKYGFQSSITAVLFNASASAHTGFEFGEYSASKAGLIGYMKHVAWRLAKHGAVCNSISCGGVYTALNDAVINNPVLWNKIMDVTPLKKWATVEEIASWIYFLTVENKSCSGQDILIDNGEKDLRCSFQWPEFKL